MHMHHSVALLGGCDNHPAISDGRRMGSASKVLLPAHDAFYIYVQAEAWNHR